MSSHRSHFRNVRFFDEANPDIVLGGLVQNGSLTERNFLVMLGIVLVSTAPIRVSVKDTGRPPHHLAVCPAAMLHFETESVLAMVDISFQVV
jgi:hypothetical protein